MNDRILKALKHALFGLFATMWNAGWNAACGIAGIDGIAMSGLSDHVHVLSLHEMLSAFVGAAVIHGALWIKNHPIPESLDTTPPMPPPPR